jgi:hypothetical protein
VAKVPLAVTTPQNVNDRIAGLVGLGTLRLGSEIFYVLNSAFLVLDVCRNERIAVLGLEGFIIHDGEVTAPLTKVYDFSAEDMPRGATSWDDYVRRTIDLSEKVLEEWHAEGSPGLYANFVFEPEEPSSHWWRNA